MELKYVPTVCPFCGTGCSFNLVVKDGKVAGSAAFQRSPVCRGKTCQKGHFAYELVNSQARITKPLIKKGDALVEASWEEALAEAAKIGSYNGNDAVVVASGNATNEDIIVLGKFAKEVLKTENFTSTAAVGIDATAGVFENIAKADCIVAVGNIVESHPLVAREIVKAKDNGAKIVVVDTYKSPTAKLATDFVKAAPGAEAAAVAEAEALVAGKSIAVIYGIGVTCCEAAVAGAAKKLADAKKAAFYAIPAQSNGRGALTFGATADLDKATEGKKAYFIAGEDIGPLSAEFVVVIDSFMTSTAKTANVVLPAAVFAEVEGTAINGEGRIQCIRKAQDAPEGVKACWQVVADVAEKAGVKFGFESAEAIFKSVKSDLSYAAISKDGFVLPVKAAVVADKKECAVETSAEFPFALTTAATIWHGFGGSGTLSANCKSLVREVPDIFVKISRADADELEIIPGMYVKVTTSVGSLVLPVMITKDLEKGVIFVPSMSNKDRCICMLTAGAKATAAKIEKVKVEA